MLFEVKKIKNTLTERKEIIEVLSKIFENTKAMWVVKTIESYPSCIYCGVKLLIIKLF